MAESLKQDTAPTKTGGVGEFVRMILLAAIIAFGIRTFVFEPFNIPSGSMVPGLQIGDFLFVSKYTYGYSSKSATVGVLPIEGRVGGSLPQRGDVIVFKPPPKPEMDFIKRLIAVPGDLVAVKSGVIYINDKPIQRERIGPVMFQDREGPNLRPATEYRETIAPGVSYSIYQEVDDGPLDNFGPVTVPPGHYFFMGDNRNNSQDSRTNYVGFVPLENIVGKAQFIWFSLEPPTSFFEIWQWPFAVRWERMFRKIN